MAREGIGSSQKVAWDMDDFQIKVCEVKQPACLAAVQVLGLTEVCQVLVICKDLDREGEAMEIMSPGFQGTDDCEKLSVVDIIVSFCRDERLREVGARVPVAV